MNWWSKKAGMDTQCALTWGIWLSNCKLWYKTEKLAWLALIKCFSVLVRLSVLVSRSWIWTDGRSIDFVSPPERNFGRLKRNCSMVDFQLIWSKYEFISQFLQACTDARDVFKMLAERMSGGALFRGAIKRHRSGIDSTKRSKSIN